jgi:hypothetical protein
MICLGSSSNQSKQDPLLLPIKGRLDLEQETTRAKQCHADFIGRLLEHMEGSVERGEVGIKLWKDRV